MSNSRESLLADVEAFIRQHRLSVSGFGRQAAGDASFVAKLRLSTRSPTLDKYDQVRDFMQHYKPRPQRKVAAVKPVRPKPKPKPPVSPKVIVLKDRDAVAERRGGSTKRKAAVVWTEPVDAVIEQLHNDGLKAQQIAVVIKVSSRSTRARMRALGLVKKRSYVRRKHAA